MTEELPHDAGESADSQEERSTEEPSKEDGDQEAKREDEAPAEEPVDRRRSYRLNKVLGAELEHGGEVTRARLFIIDISTSGFKATNHSALPVDEDMGVRIALTQKEEPIDARARVVWQKELTLSGMFQCGFQFTEMADESQKRLEGFIEAERQKSHSPQEAIYLGRPWTPIR